jgi:hypothetical protein
MAYDTNLVTTYHVASNLYFVSEPSYKYVQAGLRHPRYPGLVFTCLFFLVYGVIETLQNQELLRLAVPWPWHDIYLDDHLLEPSQLWQCRALIKCPCRESVTANPFPRILHLQFSPYLDAGRAMEPDGMAEEGPKGFAKSPG